MKITALHAGRVPDVVLLCAECGENEARYVDEYARLMCGTCPVKGGIDAIKLTDVPMLLALARRIMRPIDDPAHFKIGGSIPGRLGRFPSHTLADYIDALKDLLGRKPKLP